MTSTASQPCAPTQAPRPAPPASPRSLQSSRTLALLTRAASGAACALRLAQSVLCDAPRKRSRPLSSRLSHTRHPAPLPTYLHPSVHAGNLNVHGEEFVAVLRRLDECLEFLKANPTFADAAVFTLKFRQLQSRALSAVRAAVQQELQKAGKALQRWVAQEGASSLAGGNEDVVLATMCVLPSLSLSPSEPPPPRSLCHHSCALLLRHTHTQPTLARNPYPPAPQHQGLGVQAGCRGAAGHSGRG